MHDLKTYNILSITKDKLKESNIIKCVSVQAHLILLCFVLWCFTDNCVLFLQTEGLWQPCMEQIYWSHFSNSVCSLCVCVSDFGNCHSISNFLTITVIVTVICHQ